MAVRLGIPWIHLVMVLTQVIMMKSVRLQLHHAHTRHVVGDCGLWQYGLERGA